MEDKMREDAISAAMESGFLISTFHGQKTEKMMPTADSATLTTFYAKAYQTGRNHAEAELAEVKAAFEEAHRNYQEVAAKWDAAEIALTEAKDNYQGAMADIEELLRVIRTNPAGLDDFVAMNYPKEKQDGK